jgi:Domain of unknown function (DUF4386)
MRQPQPTLTRPRMESSELAGTPHRRIAVVVGALFIMQILTFAVGAQLVERYLSDEAEKSTLIAGVVLEMTSGLMIVTIGLLMYRVLRIVDPRLALGYPAMRLTEFAVSALLALYLLTQLEEFPHHLVWVYLPTAIGGLILNYLFLTSGLVPRPIALLGLIGYALLLATVPLDLSGAIDVKGSVGTLMLAPGGLYEFLVLPIWLFTKGFRMPYTR